MKNIYDQTAPAPVAVSNCWGVPRLILKIPRLRRVTTLEHSGGCNRPLF